MTFMSLLIFLFKKDMQFFLFIINFVFENVKKILQENLEKFYFLKEISVRKPAFSMYK